MRPLSFLSLLLALVLHVTGCTETPFVGPDEAATFAVSAPAVSDVGAAIPVGFFSEADVISFADFTTVQGTSALVRTPEGLTLRVRNMGLPDRHAVTVWWIVFNNPDACATTPCNEPDLFDPAVEADILYAAGTVTREGYGRFEGHLREGDTTGSVADVFGMPAASGLHNAETAEVHFIVRSHGPADPEIVEEQTSTLLGGCAVELPVGEVPEAPGECADVQFGVHMPVGVNGIATSS